MKKSGAKNQILILDFGSQVTQLIARRIRELSVYCEIMPYNVEEDKIKEFFPKGIILSGGPESVSSNNFYKIPEIVLKLGVPVLGICYGQQIICETFGGVVSKAKHREFGKTKIEIVNQCQLTNNIWNIGSSHVVWMSHSDFISAIPDGFVQIARTKNSPFAVIADERRKFYGVQFHPEVSHTPEGKKIIENFVLKIACCKQDWNISSFADAEIGLIKQTVGEDDFAICALSGGIDSTVTAALMKRAIGDRLINIFINNGLLRKGEAEQILNTMRNICGFKVIYVDASEYFLSRLHDIADPEEKRKIIGSSFIEVFESIAQKYTKTNNQKNNIDIEKKDQQYKWKIETRDIADVQITKGRIKFLAQGTLYPDIIESLSNAENSSNKVTIKSHHNVGGLPENLALELIEPLKYLFKDEVRHLGLALGISDKILKRHPFPGPGLAVRIIGEISEEKCRVLREIDMIFLEELDKCELYDKIWQAFAVLLPIKSVGVVGDARQYGYVCALRAVTSSDGMTADFFEFDMHILSKIATRITNEVHEISRVVYDITSKPPATIEWE